MIFSCETCHASYLYVHHEPNILGSFSNRSSTVVVFFFPAAPSSASQGKTKCRVEMHICLPGLVAPYPCLKHTCAVLSSVRALLSFLTVVQSSLRLLPRHSSPRHMYSIPGGKKLPPYLKTSTIQQSVVPPPLFLRMHRLAHLEACACGSMCKQLYQRRTSQSKKKQYFLHT